jgi:hypothetical protein
VLSSCAFKFNLCRYSEVHKMSVDAQAPSKAAGKPKRNLKFLMEWYDACPGLKVKVGPGR